MLNFFKRLLKPLIKILRGIFPKKKPIFFDDSLSNRMRMVFEGSAAPMYVHGANLTPGVQSQVTLAPLPDKTSSLEKVRQFKAVLILDGTSDLDTTMSFNFKPETGNSFLKLGAETSTVRTRKHSVTLISNERGYLSSIATLINAKSMQQAREFFEEVYPLFLDRLSFDFESPIHVRKISIFDLETGQVQWFYSALPEIKEISSNYNQEPYEDLIPFYSMFREAVSSSNPHYKAFCYYKILEGIFSTLKRSLILGAKINNLQIANWAVIVPDTIEIRQHTPELVGMKVGSVYSNLLQGKFRNMIAHFSETDDETGNELALIITNPNAVFEVNKYVPVLHATCKLLITAAEEQLDILLRESQN